MASLELPTYVNAGERDGISGVAISDEVGTESWLLIAKGLKTFPSAKEVGRVVRDCEGGNRYIKFSPYWLILDVIICVGIALIISCFWESTMRRGLAARSPCKQKPEDKAEWV